ncbi:MAG: hypothetical protein C0609_01810 [Deltaproteobacteria bacterium]|nr:MAG: hypothetical protein C0609_01810 [Deltaproteobacteria bacterium]
MKGAALYICHCGHNIAATVDVADVAKSFEGAPGVSVVRHYPYLCSRPGQELIKNDLKAGGISRVVIAACSPRMHEKTFRKAVESEGLNPYLFNHVNIREQCSWVHPERDEATAKAKELLRGGLERVRLQEPLYGSTAEVTPRALVVGGGPAGLSATAQLAGQGLEVVLCEREASLGGRAARVGRSFTEGGEVGPWLDKLIEKVYESDLVEVMTGAEVVGLEGAPGSFSVTMKTDSGQETRETGAVIIATGSSLYRPDDPEEGRPELGFGEDKRIITQEDFEGLLRGGELIAVDGAPVDAVAFLQCIGSRDKSAKGSHCSRICCMTSVRQAEDFKTRYPKARVDVIYMDLRAYARGAEEAYEAAGRRGVVFRRGSASEIFKDGEERVVAFEDTLNGEAARLKTDLVVLACGARPREDVREVSRLFGAAQGPDGFFQEAHPKLRPSETASDGVYLAGACQAPKTIDEAVTSGRAAAAKAALPLLRGWTPIDPVVAEIDDLACVGCGLCAAACPFGAISPMTHRAVMRVNPALCKGCGACSAACPSKAATLKHFRPDQLLAEVAAFSS